MFTWAVIGPMLLKGLFSLAITVAEKMGLMNKFDAGVAKGAFSLEQFVSHLKTYSNNDQLNPANSDFPAEVKSR